jgi:phosphoenolpyruvate synthase/pyruvate phosphate dikinase
VNVQAMVFGNMGETSATGVAFTRNPSTGEKELYGEFLINAQGEDVVAGIRTPQDITEAARIASGSDKPSMERAMPEAYGELVRIYGILEKHYRDMQDMEFTVEKGKLWMLQTRNGKRTAKAALRIAVELASEGLITEEEAVNRVDPAALDQLLHPTIDPKAERKILASGLPASPGAASGEIVFNSEDAEAAKKAGHKVILVRVETSPEDIHGMHAAEGILTTRGGMTSHAAVVARGMGKPCVSGAGSIRVDYAAQTLTVAGQALKKGDVITVDGSTGQVLLGQVKMLEPELSGEFATLMGWADKVRHMRVRANAETPLDAKTARNFGAEGIGLCRTEHMFFEGDRIVAVREMILSDDEAGRRAALLKLLPMQRKDFIELFTIMSGLPVTIRLLDPPLHEFLPHSEEEMQEVAKAMNAPVEKLKRRAVELHEFNPMLGFRGCRLAVAYPEIAEMQARAIFEAAVEAGRQTGEPVVPEVMVPLVMTKAELDLVKARIVAMAEAVQGETGVTVEYQVGTMIELPRAALRAGEIAEAAEFFSFGTNDLTQTALGISRDDAASFLGTYTQKGICPPIPSSPSTRRAWANSSGSRRSAASAPATASSSDLRRAWGRSRLDPLLPGGRARLRVLLPLPGADRPPRRSPGGARRQGREPGLRYDPAPKQTSLHRRGAGLRHRDRARGDAAARLAAVCRAARRMALRRIAGAGPRHRPDGRAGQGRAADHGRQVRCRSRRRPYSHRHGGSGSLTDRGLEDGVAQGFVPLRRGGVRGRDRSRTGDRMQLLHLPAEGLSAHLRAARGSQGDPRRGGSFHLHLQHAHDPAPLLLHLRFRHLRRGQAADRRGDGRDQRAQPGYGGVGGYQAGPVQRAGCEGLTPLAPFTSLTCHSGASVAEPGIHNHDGSSKGEQRCASF